MKSRLFVAGVLMAGMVLSAGAGTVTVLDISVNVSQAPYGGPSDGQTILSQSFTPNFPLLAAVELRYWGYENLPMTARMDIRAPGGTWDGGTLLGSKTATFPGPMTYADPETWVRWTFDPPIEVVPGNPYILFYTVLSGSMGTGHSTSDVYAGGILVMSFNNGASWNLYYGQDECFKTYTEVPAPATLALLGLGGLVLLRNARLRINPACR